jgi:hypothetical protein
MDRRAQRALERLLRKMARPPRARRAGFSRAPLILALGLVLGYHLLVRLVPMVWAATLPGGLDQARMLRGWPGLVFRLAVLCSNQLPAVAWGIGGMTLSAFLAARLGWPGRVLSWVAAVAMIVVDAAIVVVTVGTALTATAAGAGIGLTGGLP